jgi:hypothetical protein
MGVVGMNKSILFTALLCFTLILISEPASAIPAFPGAEGFGADTPGGRGGQVVFVTNTNDYGPGSLREALTMEVPRIIVFRTSGTILWSSPVTLTAANSYVTVAGETAPGDGIAIRGYPLKLGDRNPSNAFHDGIFRHLRFRLGTTMTDCSEASTVLVLEGSNHFIFDHCSFSWDMDQVFTVWGHGTHDFTVQWSILAEGACEIKCPGTGSSCGDNLGPFIAGGEHIYDFDYHHNYVAHKRYRNWGLFAGQGCTFTNNVNYNTYDHDYNVDQIYCLPIEVDFINNYSNKDLGQVAGLIILIYYLKGNITVIVHTLLPLVCTYQAIFLLIVMINQESIIIPMIKKAWYRSGQDHLLLNLLSIEQPKYLLNLYIL